MEITNDARHVLQFINQTQQSIFLTGKAGTGKTTLLRQIIETTHKNTVVVAPTGIAALNAGGVTIHSMFQLPLSGFIPDYKTSISISEYQKFETKNTLVKHFKMSGQKRSVLQNMELLIIDEVSMLRADLLDAIDFTLRKTRKIDQPYGGIQVLFIGDLQQLPPVVKNEEWQVLRNYYRGIFFFNAHVIHELPPLYIELSKIFRQSDEQFIAVLSNLRDNKVSKQDVELLNQFVQPNFDIKKNKGYISLTTHNAKADQLNAVSLNDIKEKSVFYKADVMGDFPEKIYPIEFSLELKVGAQIMFIKNDLSLEKNYYNGKMGVIKSLAQEEILIYFPDEHKTIEVEKYEWKNIRYSVNTTTKEIDEEVLGTFVQYPIKLAWAITVHKSQGLTFEKAVLDVSKVFLPGQAYVALSRLRSLDGLVLVNPIQMNGISNDADVMQYAENKADENQIQQSLQQGTKQFIHHYIKNCFDWINLAQEFRNHRFSYAEITVKSEKSKHQEWAESQDAVFASLVEPATKFRIQLDRLFLTENISYSHIQERLAAAFDYFYPKLDQLLFDLLLKMEEVKRVKRVKEYYQELHELEEKLSSTILRLLKAVKLLKTMISGVEINKENLTSEKIRQYKSEKLKIVEAHFKTIHKNLLVEEVENYYDYSPKKKKQKTDKKSTLQETFELWQQQKTISEIAKIRVLTTQTIYSHLGKLIQAGSITIQDVMPSDKIEQLSEAFYGYKEESLNALKEQVGNKFSWEELRLYKASLN